MPWLPPMLDCPKGSKGINLPNGGTDAVTGMPSMLIHAISVCVCVCVCVFVDTPPCVEFARVIVQWIVCNTSVNVFYHFPKKI